MIPCRTHCALQVGMHIASIQTVLRDRHIDLPWVWHTMGGAGGFTSRDFRCPHLVPLTAACYVATFWGIEPVCAKEFALCASNVRGDRCQGNGGHLGTIAFTWGLK